MHVSKYLLSRQTLLVLYHIYLKLSAQEVIHWYFFTRKRIVWLTASILVTRMIEASVMCLLRLGHLWELSLRMLPLSGEIC